MGLRAILATLPVCGTAKLHNVAVYVTADDNLYFPQIKRQIHALLGFPVIYALGRLTFTHDGTLVVSAHSPAADPKTDAHLWFAGHALLVPLGTQFVKTGDHTAQVTEQRLFVIDTGSRDTFFTNHFVAEHTQIFAGPPLETARLAGAGGEQDIPAYSAHNLPLFAGSTPILLTGPHVLTRPLEGALGRYYGLIGQDVLGTLASYTLDFRTGAFSVKR